MNIQFDSYKNDSFNYISQPLICTEEGFNMIPSHVEINTKSPKSLFNTMYQPIFNQLNTLKPEEKILRCVKVYKHSIITECKIIHKDLGVSFHDLSIEGRIFRPEDFGKKQNSEDTKKLNNIIISKFSDVKCLLDSVYTQFCMNKITNPDDYIDYFMSIVSKTNEKEKSKEIIFNHLFDNDSKNVTLEGVAVILKNIGIIKTST